ncbi:MAG: Spy/CpxP family protein refolding chaperone [bacterium]
MRSKWLILALVFSVAVNGAALVTIGYQWWRSRQPARPPIELRREILRRQLNLTEDQFRRVRDAQGQVAEEMEAMRKSLRAKRAELVRLLREPDPDRAEIDARLREIATLQADLERRVVDNLLKLKGVLTPEQREKLLSIIDHHLMGPGRRGRRGRFGP